MKEMFFPNIYFNNIALPFMSTFNCIEHPCLFLNRLHLPLNRTPQVCVKVNLYYFKGWTRPLKGIFIKDLYINVFLNSFIVCKVIVSMKVNFLNEMAFPLQWVESSKAGQDLSLLSSNGVGSSLPAKNLSVCRELCPARNSATALHWCED